MRLLLAEDDYVLADGLTRSMRQAGYAVDCVNDGAKADAALMAQQYDLLILDVGLPMMSGLDVLRRVRARHASVPTLILTAGDSVEQRVKALDLGADDFMAKPFSLCELEARVRALLRRGCGEPNIIRNGPLRYDQGGRIAYMHDRMLELSARELTLLDTLLLRAGRVVTKDQLVDVLCARNTEISNNAIEVYVHRLRKKIEIGGLHIATIRGLGYCMEKISDAVTPAVPSLGA